MLTASISWPSTMIAWALEEGEGEQEERGGGTDKNGFFLPP